MTRHTPGPWTAEGPRVLSPHSCGYVECCGIAECFHGSRKDVAEANARLVAASPDLKDALSDLLAHYVVLVASGDAGNWDAEAEEEVIAARAALARCGAA